MYPTQLHRMSSRSPPSSPDATDNDLTRIQKRMRISAWTCTVIWLHAYDPSRTFVSFGFGFGSYTTLQPFPLSDFNEINKISHLFIISDHSFFMCNCHTARIGGNFEIVLAKNLINKLNLIFVSKKIVERGASVQLKSQLFNYYAHRSIFFGLADVVKRRAIHVRLCVCVCAFNVSF